MQYEWDSSKARNNVRRHRISFDEAVTVFLDPFALTFDDPDHSIAERRFITLGTSTRGRVPFVAHADRDQELVRIISARRATPTERHAYQERPT